MHTLFMYSGNKAITKLDYAETVTAKSKPSHYATTETHLICVAPDGYGFISITQYDHYLHKWATLAATTDGFIGEIKGFCGSQKWIVIVYNNMYAHVYNREIRVWYALTLIYMNQVKQNPISLSKPVIFEDKLYFFSAFACKPSETRMVSYDLLTHMLDCEEVIDSGLDDNADTRRLRHALVY